MFDWLLKIHFVFFPDCSDGRRNRKHRPTGIGGPEAKKATGSVEKSEAAAGTRAGAGTHGPIQ